MKQIFFMDRTGDLKTKGVEYWKIVSGDVGMNMMVILGGGSEKTWSYDDNIHKDLCLYPFQGVTDKFPVVCYRSNPKGWIETRIFEEWTREYRVVRRLLG